MKFLILPLLLTLSACGQFSNKMQPVDPRAKKLNDSATLIAMKQLDYSKAISLIDQAIQIDSNYFKAYSNKLTFQIELKLYDQAIKTAFKISQLKPDNPDYYVTIGVLYNIQGDSVISQKYFRGAMKIFDKMLDTMSTTNRNYDMLLIDKGLNYIFVGEQQKGNDILKNLYNKQKESPFKEMLASYIDKSKQDIINMLITPMTSEVSPQSN